LFLLFFVFFVTVWIFDAVFNLANKADYLEIIAMLLVILGMVFFVIGRIIVGLQSRKINFLTGRARTIEEEWFLEEMLNVETVAARLNIANQFAKILQNKADDILLATNSTGVVKHWFNVGKIYMGNNFFLNRLFLIISLISLIVFLIINII